MVVSPVPPALVFTDGIVHAFMRLDAVLGVDPDKALSEIFDILE